jgi:WD40 repeat protein
MIPEHRLATLLSDVKQNWIDECYYHNTDASPSLFIEHKCDRQNFPTTQKMALRKHTDEVYYLKYSHDGRMLASAGRDRTVIVYDTQKDYRIMYTLRDHTDGITHLAWSLDDTKLVSCSAGQENCAKIWSLHVSGPLVCLLSLF